MIMTMRYVLLLCVFGLLLWCSVAECERPPRRQMNITPPDPTKEYPNFREKYQPDQTRTRLEKYQAQQTLCELNNDDLPSDEMEDCMEEASFEGSTFTRHRPQNNRHRNRTRQERNESGRNNTALADEVNTTLLLSQQTVQPGDSTSGSANSAATTNSVGNSQSTSSASTTAVPPATVNVSKSQQTSHASGDQSTRNGNENDSKSQEDDSKSQEDGNKSQEDGNKSQEDGNKSQEDDSKSQEDGNKSQEDGNKSQEDDSKSQEDDSKSQEDGSKSQEDVTPPSTDQPSTALEEAKNTGASVQKKNVDHKDVDADGNDLSLHFTSIPVVLCLACATFLMITT